LCRASVPSRHRPFCVQMGLGPAIEQGTVVDADSSNDWKLEKSDWQTQLVLRKKQARKPALSASIPARLITVDYKGNRRSSTGKVRKRLLAFPLYTTRHGKSTCTNSQWIAYRAYIDDSGKRVRRLGGSSAQTR
jgi:hypothetical protein